MAGTPTARVLRTLRERCMRDGANGPSRGYWVQRKDIDNMRRSLGLSATRAGTKRRNEDSIVPAHTEKRRVSTQVISELISQKI